jgi:hypothetical protein
MITTHTSRKVNFPGHGIFWFLDDGGEDGPLAPLEHCDKDGNLLSKHTFSIAYAHFFSDGRIMRWGEEIGRKEDLIEEKATIQ